MKLEHPDRLMNRSSLSLAALECHDAFAERHIGPDSADQRAMLDALGFATRAAFIDAVIPESIRRKETLPLGAALGPFAQPKSEAEALASLRKLADQNLVFRTYIGQGYYGTHTPAVILRNVLENPAWYTAYTPYQPEISQGRLEALLNFQQMVIDLTGLAISNASLLDEATAAAEAMTLLQRVGKPKSNVFYVADDVLPQTIEVVQTRAKPVGVEVKVGRVVSLTVTLNDPEVVTFAESFALQFTVVVPRGNVPLGGEQLAGSEPSSASLAVAV
jgi:glycine dehydrogenase